MKYIFENEMALELYYVITKERGIKMTPHDFEDEVYLSEDFLMTCLTEICAMDDHKPAVYHGKNEFTS